jgi:transcriptional regulator with XRE-family HTH domain
MEMINRFQAFSINLRNERKAFKYTQKKMAELLGTTQAVYNRYERGGTPHGREPDFNTLCKIAEILSVTTDFLLGLEK